MSSRLRNVPGSTVSASIKALKAAVSLIALTAVAGCSADVTRFDSPIFGYDGKPTSALRPSEGMLGGNAQRLADEPPPAAGSAYGGYGAVPDYAPGYRPTGGERSAIDGGIATARLEPRNDNLRAAPIADRGPRAEPLPVREERHAAPVAAPAAPMASASEIIVQPGDTLYGLSRKHRVSVAALTSANSLTNNIIKPGQRLVLPGANRLDTAPAAAAGARVARRAPSQVAQPVVPVASASPAPDQAATGADSYVIKPGDSLYGISRRTRISVADLKQINGISDPRRLRPGMTLRLRGAPAEAPAATIAAAPPQAPTSTRSPVASDQPISRSVRTARVTLPPRAPAQTEPAADTPLPGSTARPTILNDSRQRVASLNPPEVKTDVPRVAPVTPTLQPAPSQQAVAVTSPSSSRELAREGGAATGFRWPVRGKVVGAFGKRPDGTHNDGINIAVPPGTDVHAVEGGVVAYAGSELKGYGNLILIRHDNGWVSAYAHNDAILVKRGDKVTRGQVISKSGKTGAIDQPQLHFELRQGSKPVDPLLHLAKG